MGKSENAGLKVKSMLRLSKNMVELFRWSMRVLIFPFWDLIKSYFKLFNICRKENLSCIPKALSLVTVSFIGLVVVMYFGFFWEFDHSDEHR